MAVPYRGKAGNHGSFRDSLDDIEIYDEEPSPSKDSRDDFEHDEDLSDDDNDGVLGDTEFNENRSPSAAPELFDHDSMDVAVKKMEPAFKVSHSYDRSFSTTTAIHLDDHIGKPFEDEDTDEEEEVEATEEAKRALVHHYSDDGGSHTIGANSRQVSDSFSAMPEEIDYNSGGYAFKQSINRGRTPQSPKRHARTETAIWSSSPVRERPGEQNQQYQHPQSNSSAARHSTPFRNPSSVRAMQMSSPSPPQAFSNSPKSAKFRREVNSRHGTPLRRIGRFPSQQSILSNSNKEYPLVLLHCSISPTVLPYSSQTLQRVLPSIMLENIAILREKIGPTVLERGILIPHPGEDYELLEERVLENLDLRAPRVGKSGHFNADEDDAYKSKIEAEQPCAICCGRLSKENSCFHKDDPVHRKWDIRVFAANGLMRSGAWSAAWKEMEKVDVELGIWLSEDLRRELEREKEAESEEQLRQMSAMHEGPKEYHNQQSSLASRPSFEEDQRQTDRAATPQQNAPDIRRRRGSIPIEQTDDYFETCKSSTSSMPQRKPQHSRISSTGASSAPISSASTHRSTMQRERLPLSTLMLNYAQRTITNRPDVLLQLFLFIAAVVYLSRLGAASRVASPSSNIEMPVIHENIQPRLASVQSEFDRLTYSIDDLESPVLTKLTSSSLAEQSTASIVTVTGSASSIPMCTFSPGEEASNHMTLVPANLARSLLSQDTQSKTSSVTRAPVSSASDSTNPTTAKLEEAKSSLSHAGTNSSRQATSTDTSQSQMQSEPVHVEL